MKKIILFITCIIALTSCECYWDNEFDRHGFVQGKKTNVLYFGTLSFYEEKLFGTWGCTDIWFGNEQVKEIVISEYGKANIQLQDGIYTDRYNRTYTYVYSGKYITFYNSKNTRESYQFKIYDYKVGSLFLQDWKGVHEIRLYSVCNGF